MSTPSIRSTPVLERRKRDHLLQQAISQGNINMTRQEILERVAQHLGEVLDLEGLKLTETSTAEDFEDWDSVNHVRLLIRIEQDLGFQFSTDDVSMVKNVGQLVDLIAARQPQA